MQFKNFSVLVLDDILKFYYYNTKIKAMERESKSKYSVFVFCLCLLLLYSKCSVLILKKRQITSTISASSLIPSSSSTSSCSGSIKSSSPHPPASYTSPPNPSPLSPPPDKSPTSCKSQSQCNSRSSCRNSKCIDTCSQKSCILSCSKGQCQCKDQSHCSKGQQCREQKCIDGCLGVLCDIGEDCLNGECVKMQRKCRGFVEGYKDGEEILKGEGVREGAGQQCGDGENCQNGVCVGVCDGVRCLSGFICVQGVCRDRQCGDNICPEKSYCQNGKCVVNQNICGSKSFLRPKICDTNKKIYEKCKKPVQQIPQGPIQFQKKIKFCGYNGEYWQTAYADSECELCLKDIKYYLQNQCPLQNRNLICNQSSIKSSSHTIQKCKGDQFCVQGSCQTSNCKTQYKTISCYFNTPYKVTVCLPPFPSSSCHQGPYLVQPGPSPDRCGITPNGTRINILPSICSPCSLQNISYYFDSPCYDAPFICQGNEICNGEYCQSLGCHTDEQCEYDWQVCQRGKCVDACVNKQCQFCKFGKCSYLQNPLGRCVFNPSPFQMLCLTDPQLSCYSNQCIDDCTRKRCPQGQLCRKGQCQEK